MPSTRKFDLRFRLLATSAVLGLALMTAGCGEAVERSGKELVESTTGGGHLPEGGTSAGEGGPIEPPPRPRPHFGSAGGSGGRFLITRAQVGEMTADEHTLGYDVSQDRWMKTACWVADHADAWEGLYEAGKMRQLEQQGKSEYQAQQIIASYKPTMDGLTILASLFSNSGFCRG